ncbi:MAG: ROK family transcriptional regulator [Actinoplanes sp.]
MGRPSFDVAWSTDILVLTDLMHHRRRTRAELAAEIGISKPTAGESVRRLAERGLVADTGERTPGGRGRGRVGSYYALAEQVGVALAVSIAPDGVVGERVDAYGDVVARADREISRPAGPEQVAAALRETVHEVRGEAAPRIAVVSAADPVDRATGRLIHLPDSPFLVGELDPVEILRPQVDGPVVVDNDVNWAARAERDNARDAAPPDFAYLYLGEGLGCAVVSDGEIRRGASGLAGEIAHLLTVGPDGRAVRLIELFGELGLRQPGSTAIDVQRLLRIAEAGPAATRDAVAAGVAGALAAIVALADPALIVVGGPWGTHPRLLAAIRAAAAPLPRQAPIEAAAVVDRPALAGARLDAVARLRDAILHGHAGRSTED